MTESIPTTDWAKLEAEEDTRVSDSQAFIVRLDGRGFSKLTQNLVRPFDKDFTSCMEGAAKQMLLEFSPKLIHTGSDEISLYFPAKTGTSQHVFGGRRQKILSIMAAFASVCFLQKAESLKLDISESPQFDARIILVDREQAAQYFLWREKNTKRNSVSMACRSVLSHKEMQGLSTSDQIAAMASNGLDWGSFPDCWRRGTYFRKENRLVRLTASDIANMPLSSLAKENDEIVRAFAVSPSFPPLATIENLADTLFGKEAEL